MGLRNCLRTGVALGFGFGTSCALTGSARRTSGSAGGASRTVGVVVEAVVAVGVGEAGATEAGGGAVVSAGCACGATILSDTVAVGEVPGPGVGLGLSRCIWKNHFRATNPITRTSTPMIKGISEPPPPPPGLLLRRRTTTGRTGSGSGASCKYE